jgi:HK97 family phage prohead protease
MKVNVRADSVEIEGYVNSVERNSKPLMSRIGRFIERICKGAFSKALKRNDDVHILLNHDWNRDLGSTKRGNLELTEDNIGLHARACITDKDVIQKARNGDLVGWSFGFQDRDVDNSTYDGMPYRAVKDLDLFEVSLLDKTKSPAYDGTLVTARAETDEIHFRGEDFIDDVNLSIDEEEPLKNEPEATEEVVEEVREEISEPKQQEIVENKIDYSKYEQLIKEMKEEI